MWLTSANQLLRKIIVPQHNAAALHMTAEEPAAHSDTWCGLVRRSKRKYVPPTPPPTPNHSVSARAAYGALQRHYQLPAARANQLAGRTRWGDLWHRLPSCCSSSVSLQVKP